MHFFHKNGEADCQDSIFEKSSTYEENKSKSIHVEVERQYYLSNYRKVTKLKKNQFFSNIFELKIFKMKER